MMTNYGSAPEHTEQAPHEVVTVVSDPAATNSPAAEKNLEAAAADENTPLIPATSERSTAVNAALAVLVVGLGMVEGAAFQRTGVFLPEAIAGQMTFKVWIIMKMFITSVGASMLCQSLLNIFLGADFDRSRSYKSKRAGLPRVVVGSSFLGVGMALAGSGPTMLPSQVGAGVHNSWAILLGALAGGLAFAIIDKLLPDLFKAPEPEPFAVDKKGHFRYYLAAIPIGLVFIAVSIALEFIVPQSDDEARLRTGALPWPATIAGVVVGVMQIPMRLIAGHGQGGSTSYMTFIGTVTCGVLSPATQFKGFAQLWQPAFVWVGTTLGSLASTQVNDFDSPTGFTYWRSVVGGFLMLFGARVAAGCTCGHGVSGFAELSFESFVAAPCIFGAGIATGYIVQAAGGHNCCGYQN